MRSILIILLSVMIYLPAFVDAKITIEHKTVKKSDNCPAKDGKNYLNPISITYLGPPGKKIFRELTTGDSKFIKLTYKRGKALSGKLIVDKYVSKFKKNHHSGAILSLRYQRGKGDPKQLRWIQMIETSAPLNRAKPPYIDPYPNDDPAGKGLPFYYTQAEIKTRRDGKNSYGKYHLRFYDFSSRFHPPTKAARWTASLYLASGSKKDKTVIIHDGIQWGWIGGCKRDHKTDDPKMSKFDPKVLIKDKIAVGVDTEKTLIQQTTRIDKEILSGAQIISSEKAVAGKPLTVTVVDRQYNTLTGVVIDCGEEKPASDEDGKCVFTVPAGNTKLPLRIYQVETKARILEVKDPAGLPFNIETEQVPQISECPAFVAPGDAISIKGGPFEGNAAENQVKIGGKMVKILSSSPLELKIKLPVDCRIGSRERLTIRTNGGISKPVDLVFIRFRLEADTTELWKGQGTKGKIIIDGTRDKVNIEVKNLTPGIISLKGGILLNLTTRGGKKNYAKIRFKGVEKGNFIISAKVSETRKYRVKYVK